MAGSPEDNTQPGDAFPRSTHLGGQLTLGSLDGRAGVFYRPPRDANLLTAGIDHFDYTVADDGRSYVLSDSSFTPGTLVDNPKTIPGRVQLLLTSVNDPPVFTGAGDVKDTTEYASYQDVSTDAQDVPIDRLQPMVIDEPFYLGKYEVTNEQWASLTNGQPPLSESDRRTVAGSLSWLEIQEAIKNLNKNLATEGLRAGLPTRAHWEYACRAGTATAWYFGDDDSDFARFGWDVQNSGGRLREVGQLEPNAWGLFDCMGNAWEWCANLPVQQFDSLLSAQVGGTRHKYMCGGSAGQTHRRCRPSTGTLLPTDYRDHLRGFRLAVSLIREPIPEDRLAFPLLEEWFADRDELTVSPDGSAMFTTIQAALDAQQDGQVVRVLDRGPYHETIQWNNKRDCGLISSVATVVREHGWETYYATSQTAHHFQGLANCRLNGLTWIFSPTSAEQNTLMRFSRTPGLCMENCVVITMAESQERLRSSVEFVNSARESDAPTCIRECVFVIPSEVRIICGHAGRPTEQGQLFVVRNWVLCS